MTVTERSTSALNGPVARMILLVLLAATVLAVPVQPAEEEDSLGDHRVRQKRSRDIKDNVLKFLYTFGYLPQSDLETGNLRTKEQVRDAIKTMQAFAHIPVTGVVDEATREMMRKPRCGLPDIISDHYRAKRSSANHDVHAHEEFASDGKKKRHWAYRTARRKRYTIQAQRWHYTNLTWSLTKGPTKAGDLDDGHVRQQVHRALSLWQKASKLTFTEVNSDTADIRVSFHSKFHNDGYPFDGKGTLLAHAFFPGSGIGGDAHFDEDEPWVPDVPSDSREGLSFFAVATHQFGHSLGLSHSSVKGAIMFPYYQSTTGDYSLSSDDIIGIQAIYGDGSPNEGARVTNPALNPTTITTTTNNPPYKPDVPTKPTVPTKKPLHPSKKSPDRPPDEATKPSTCDTSYDAISIIRHELFIFKDKYFWRIGPKGLGPNYPVEIDRFWGGLPSNLTHVDAIYEKPIGKREMVIFIGRRYWIYESYDKGTGPYPLTQLGLPEDLEKLDGAMVWGHNGKTYFFSGTMYWRFDEEIGKVELDYPTDMSIWNGVPYNIDAVFQHTNGKTYFFKNKVFWGFNDRRMRVTNSTPSLSAPCWMGCRNGMHHDHAELRPAECHLHPTKSANQRPDEAAKPSICNTSYDAISIIRHELFIFKDKYFWRIGPKGLGPNYPVEIHRFWSGLPSNLTHVDAIYEKPIGKREMVIFIGRRYWIYESYDKGTGPYPLTQLGLPEDLEKLDGAMVWGYNGNTYFFSGTMYWRFDEEIGKVELDYPRDMSTWKGVPYYIDAVFQHTNGILFN